MPPLSRAAFEHSICNWKGAEERTSMKFIPSLARGETRAPRDIWPAKREPLTEGIPEIARHNSRPLMKIVVNGINGNWIGQMEERHLNYFVELEPQGPRIIHLLASREALNLSHMDNYFPVLEHPKALKAFLAYCSSKNPLFSLIRVEKYSSGKRYAASTRPVIHQDEITPFGDKFYVLARSTTELAEKSWNGFHWL